MGDMADYYNERDNWDDGRDSEPEYLLSIKVIHETDKAFLIQHKNKQAWFPKSICDIEDDYIEWQNWFLPDWQIIATNKMLPSKGEF